MAEIYGSDASNLTPGQHRATGAWIALAVVVVLVIALALAVSRG